VKQGATIITLPKAIYPSVHKERERGCLLSLIIAYQVGTLLNFILLEIM
jgi:hypothetical protein